MNSDFNKIEVKQEKIDLNLKFYFFLKMIVKLKINENITISIFEKYNLFYHNPNEFCIKLRELFKKDKIDIIDAIIEKILSEEDIEMLVFCLRLCEIKDLLISESKIYNNIKFKELEGKNPLSLEYDKISTLKPYTSRVYGAILTLIFFERLQKKETNFLSKETHKYLEDISQTIIKLQEKGLETNQIFMLIFTECLNQSIISDSGTNYEDRIKSVITKIGITNITKKHDDKDKSSEFDFFFNFNNKNFGISAKRTLRERYKQFIKTAITSNNIDVLIEITLGIDLSEDKAKIITDEYNTYIFVADEVYKKNIFLQKNKKIFSVNDLTIETLKKL